MKKVALLFSSLETTTLMTMYALLCRPSRRVSSTKYSAAFVTDGLCPTVEQLISDEWLRSKASGKGKFSWSSPAIYFLLSFFISWSLSLDMFFPTKSMLKKPDMLKLVRSAKHFCFALTLVLIIGEMGAMATAEKPPTLNYGIIRHYGNGPPSTSKHPPPINHRQRGCNPGNFCHNFTLYVKSSNSQRVEGYAIVEAAAAPTNATDPEPGTEAIGVGIAAWFLNKTNVGNASKRLSVSDNATSYGLYDADSLRLQSARKKHLQAISRGIKLAGMAVQSRSELMSTKDEVPLLPVDGEITIILVNAANSSEEIGLKLFANVQRLEDNDILQIFKHAEAFLQANFKP